MASIPPSSSVQSDPRNIYYPTRLASGYGMMAEIQRSQSAAHTLPPPPTMQAASRHLPPPSHLEPSFVPQSPQVRPQYSDLPTRNYPVYDRPSPHAQPPAQDFRQPWQTSVPLGLSGHAPSFPHPPLYPSKASFQSTNPGTVYEALSPVRYGMDEPPPEASLFNEGAYSTTTFPAGHSSHQSPISSYRGSITSSSGHSTGSMHFPKPAPVFEASSRPGDMTDRYILTLRQQPIAARACGFGERDRRVIDPPPIVQLSLKDFNPKSSADIAELRWPFNIVHCALLSVLPQPSTYPPTSDVTAVPDPNQSNRVSRRLMGTLVASPFVGNDPEAPQSSDDNARLGCFFVFPDLSCRQNGHYRLRFTLMKVSMPNSTEDGQGSIAGSIDSDVFEVFSAKDFPGMRASTALTKELKRQGATVSVKKGKGQRKRGGSGSEKSSSDESDGASKVPKSRQKKKRA
ncbi:MAG: hypothetical protein ALECFALPRED_000302 [Alectoria fallacina]|uniref:Velvet domain-containing protein n=1 Tax=Alectoria fallacina TaxID=1903189 RepID=A0A8H3JAH5_9LECA|nr:MAG: hypothetical protein ALECFALPRED_000302 [Alectoria fallacina]